MGDATPCCPACHRSYTWGDETCPCGTELECVTGGSLSSSGLPTLDKHGPPPSDVPVYWLEVEGTPDVRFRGVKAVQFPIGTGPLLIGRRDAQTNNYPEIDLQAVADYGFTARRHARLGVVAGKLFLTDLKGEGTTAINDLANTVSRDQPAELHDGDCIIIGEKVTLRVVVHESE